MIPRNQDCSDDGCQHEESDCAKYRYESVGIVSVGIAHFDSPKLTLLGSSASKASARPCIDAAFGSERK